MLPAKSALGFLLWLQLGRQGAKTKKNRELAPPVVFTLPYQTSPRRAAPDRAVPRSITFSSARSQIFQIVAANPLRQQSRLSDRKRGIGETSSTIYSLRLKQTAAHFSFLLVFQPVAGGQSLWRGGACVRTQPIPGARLPHMASL